MLATSKLGRILQLSDNLILVNYSCSANCRHCPYGKQDSLPRPHSEVIKDINLAQDELIILSGGEPLELQENSLQRYVQAICLLRKYFRIATGGFVCLSRYDRWLDPLPWFHGFQIGTDVLFESRNSSFDYFSTLWEENIDYLNENMRPYSITITLGPDVSVEDISDKLVKTHPQFVMLNSLQSTCGAHATRSKEIARISEILPRVRIIDGFGY